MSNIYDREMKFFQAQISKPRYCSFCGKILLLSPVDDNNRPNEHYKWEWENKAHRRCVENHFEKMQ